MSELSPEPIKDSQSPLGVNKDHPFWLVLSPYVGMLALAATLIRLANRSILGQPELVSIQPDVAATEVKTYAAAHFGQLTGAFSRYGFAHPGPGYYAWLAPFYRASGYEMSGLQIGTATFHLCALTAALVIVGVRSPWFTTGVVGVGLSLWVGRYGIEHFFQMWNPLVTATATIALLACLGAVGANPKRVAPWSMATALGLGSFIIQSHASAAVAVVVAVAVAVGAAGFNAWRQGILLRLLAPSLVVMAVMWAPPVLDQVNGSHNVTALARYFVAGEELPTTFPFAPGETQERQSARTTVPLTTAAMTLRLDDLGGQAGVDIIKARNVHGEPLDVFLLIGLVAATAWAAWTQRFRYPYLAAVGGSTLAMAAGALLSTLTIRGPTFQLYQVHFVTGIGFWLWAVPATLAVLHLKDLVAPRVPTTALAPARIAAAVAMLAVSVFLVTAPAPSRLVLFPYQRQSAADLVIERRPDLKRVNLETVESAYTNEILRAAVGFQHAGVKVGASPRWGFYLASDQTPLIAGAPTVYLTPPDRPPSKGELLGTWSAGPGTSPIAVYLLEAAK